MPQINRIKSSHSLNEKRKRLIFSLMKVSEGCCFSFRCHFTFKHDVITLALHRKERSIPVVRTSIFRDIFTNAKYEKLPTNMYLEHIPTDKND
jgi:hypothetical protein